MGLPPEFFDFFGLGVFSFIVLVSIFMLRKKKLPRWIPYILLSIGLLGLITDSIIVLNSYLLP